MTAEDESKLVEEQVQLARAINGQEHMMSHKI